MLELYKQGKTDKQVAKAMGVSVRTLNYWKGRHPSFKAALMASKSIADDLVEAALFQRALGFTRRTRKQTVYYGQVVNFTDAQYFAADIQAIQFWLKNRRPKKWRDKTQSDVNFNDLSKLSDEQLRAQLEKLQGKK